MQKSVLQLIVTQPFQAYKKFGVNGVESLEGKARRSVVEFSLIRCREYVRGLSHQVSFLLRQFCCLEMAL